MRERYGTMPDGAQIDILTLRNANGIEVRAITYGGIITSMKVPDRAGKLGDVALGFDSLAGYLDGASVLRRHRRPLRQPHRRRARSRSTAARTRWRRTTARTTCTAASRASTRVSGSAQAVPGSDAVVFTRTSPDGEEGYPGQPRGARHLHAHRQERADRRLPRDDRQGDAGQPDAAQLLQPCRRGQRATSSATS